MSSPLSIALSGMAAAGLRLQVSAANVANMRTSGPLPGADPAGFAPAYVPLRVNQVEAGDGGTSAGTAPVSPSFVAAFDPGAPFADHNGMVAAPNVDLADELVQQFLARYAFVANAKIMQADLQMTRTLIDISA